MNTFSQQWLSFAEPGWRQLLIFKAGWLGLVLQPLYSAAIIASLLLWFIWQLKLPQRQALLTLWASGLLLDLLLTLSGLFQFDTTLLPYWLVLLWGWFSLFWLMLFSRWLPSPLLVALFGLVGGPLAYWGGAQLSSSLQIMDGAEFWLVMAPAWAALLLWSRQTEAWWQQYHLNRSRNHVS
ncbi:DUF2878 family protein [Rheinheimera sp.]|jgi:hypothetical protein|uniref:DUF2878 family protein n=1 Tax=Rheinheimera sp. TaxID=1869214 RepID=UPI003D298B13